MPIYSQIPIRCRLSIVSNPPVSPIDDNTGEAPRFWRAQDVSVQVGIFDASNVAVDLENISVMQLTLREAPTSPYALFSKSLGVNDIIPVISYAAWARGTEQQVSFNLSSAETDLALNGEDSAQFWLDIRGTTSTGSQLIYGAGYITVYNPGAAVTPSPASQVTSYHATANTAGNSTVSPTNQIHTEVITINGIARTSSFLVQTSNMVAGNRATLLFIYPTVANIVLSIYNQSTSGTLLATFTTDGVQTNGSVELYFDGVSWNPLNSIIPSFR